MIDEAPHSKPFDLATVEKFPELWCQKLGSFFADVVTLLAVAREILDRLRQCVTKRQPGEQE